MNSEKLSTEDIAAFTWMFGRDFFLETDKGNFVWQNPEYGGDNTIQEYDGDYSQFCMEIDIPYGRDKGKHRIADYCGAQVKLP